MPRKTTIIDIAKAVGVTPATVSNVLNGTKRVSEETRKRILQVAEELRYTPNLSARGLVKNRTYHLGLFIPGTPSAFLDPYFSELLRGLTEVALQRGYIISIIYANALDETIRSRVDGLVLTEVKVKDEYVNQFREMKIPFVVLANGEQNGVQDYVVSDTRRGLEEALKYLFRIGHRQLGYALGPVAYAYVHERYTLFREIQREMGFEFEPSHVATGSNNRAGGRDAVRRILNSSHKPPTAILASTDIMALGAIEYLKSKDYDVPGDLSVVGFDDASFSKYVNPSITTIRHDVYQLGRHAAMMLMAKLDESDYEHPVTLPVKFVVRESTK